MCSAFTAKGRITVNPEYCRRVGDGIRNLTFLPRPPAGVQHFAKRCSELGLDNLVSTDAVAM